MRCNDDVLLSNFSSDSLIEEFFIFGINNNDHAKSRFILKFSFIPNFYRFF